MNLKKLYIFVLVFLVFSIGIFAIYAATADNTAPTITRLKIAEPSKGYSAGDKVYIDMDLYDDISGVESAWVVFVKYIDEEDLNPKYIGQPQLQDINGEPYLLLPKNLEPGLYGISLIYISDRAGNFVKYTSSEEDRYENGYQSYEKYLDFVATFNVKIGGSDLSKPILRSIKFDKERVTPKEDLHVEVDTYDDISGIKEISFGASDGLKTQTIASAHNFEYNSEKNKYVADISVPTKNGTYKFSYIYITDNNGNVAQYYNKEISGWCEGTNTCLPNAEEIKFTVYGSTKQDTEPPKLLSIKYDKDAVSPPSQIKVIIEATDDLSGLNDYVRMQIGRKNEDGKYISNPLFNIISTKTNNGKIEVIMEVPQYVNPGIYAVTSIELYDLSNNDVTYSLYPERSEYIKLELKNTFNVVPSETYDLVTSTIDKKIIEKIEDTSDDAKIVIDSTNNSIIKEEIFNSILNTNKTIIIESNGIQWVFNGKDIKKRLIKDIDVNLNIETIFEYTEDEELQKIINKGLVINFKPNGKLPGKALVRIKAEYTFRNYIGIENLFVYYYKNKKFDTVIKELSITEDGYYEFNISHNSTYVMVDKEPEEEYISEDKSILALNIEEDIESEDKEIIEAKKILVKQEMVNKVYDNMYLYILLGIVIVLIPVVILIIIKIRKSKKVKQSLEKTKQNI